VRGLHVHDGAYVGGGPAGRERTGGGYTVVSRLTAARTPGLVVAARSQIAANTSAAVSPSAIQRRVAAIAAPRVSATSQRTGCARRLPRYRRVQFVSIRRFFRAPVQMNR